MAKEYSVNRIHFKPVIEEENHVVLCCYKSGLVTAATGQVLTYLVSMIMQDCGELDVLQRILGKLQ